MDEEAGVFCPPLLTGPGYRTTYYGCVGSKNPSTIAGSKLERLNSGTGI
jgi:hypothetical protein